MEFERLLVQLGRRAGAFVLPGGDVRVVLVVAQRFAFRRLIFLAKMAAAGFIPLQRVLKMVAVANRELFGSCTNIGECEAVCPKLIKLEVIARMNRDYIQSSWSKRE